MKNKKFNDYDDFDYEPYEERKGRIKQVASVHRPKREIKNWKQAWNDHTDDFDSHDEFFAKKPPRK